ncbi:MAG: peptidylprolyl isomerase [Acidobacteriota bacterium]|nr:peptidylprolyl isomerase [Acidobacteriota bacterium]
MSIVRLRKAFRRKMKIGFGKARVQMSPMDLIFWAIVAIFVVGAYYTFGAPSGGGGGEGGGQQARKVTRTVATVNGKAITRNEFEQRYIAQISDVPQDQFLASDRYVKTSILEGMVQRILMLDAARKRGIEVSRQDINNKINELVQERVDQQFPNRKSMVTFLRKRQQTLDQYKAELRKELAEDPEMIREAVLFERLEESVKNEVKVTDEDLKEEYTKVKARHILIKPDQLRMLDEAAKGDKGKDAAKKKDKPDKDYDAEAKKKAEEILAKLKKGEDFAKLAKAESHDFGSAQQGGMLQSTRPPAPGQDAAAPDPYFGRGEMVPEFEEAAFKLKPNEFSEPVKSQFGYHIIQTLDKKVAYPEDFEKKKDEYRTQLLEKKKDEHWREFVEKQREAANIEIQDPELAAYKALEEDKKTEGIQLLASAVEADPTNVGAKYQLANLMKEAGEKSKAIDLLKQLAQSERSSSNPQVHMDLALLLLEEKLTDEAIDELKAASDWAQSYDYQSMFIHQQAMEKFRELKKPDLAAAEQEWIDEFTKFQQEQQQQQMPIMPMQ